MLRLHLWSALVAILGLSPFVASAQTDSDIAAYIKGLKSPDPDVRRQAALALEKLGPQAVSAVPALQAALRDPDQFVRRFSIRALGAIGPGAANAVPDLVQLLSSQHREEAEAAVAALAKIGKPAVKPLAKALESTNDPLLVRSIAKALGSIGPDAVPAVGPLIQQMKAPAKGVIKAGGLQARVDMLAAIVEALGNIGPAAKEAIPEIKALLNDKLLAKNKEFRAIANTAIKKIGATSK